MADGGRPHPAAMVAADGRRSCGAKNSGPLRTALPNLVRHHSPHSPHSPTRTTRTTRLSRPHSPQSRKCWSTLNLSLNPIAHLHCQTFDSQVSPWANRGAHGRSFGGRACGRERRRGRDPQHMGDLGRGSASATFDALVSKPGRGDRVRTRCSN